LCRDGAFGDFRGEPCIEHQSIGDFNRLTHGLKVAKCYRSVNAGAGLKSSKRPRFKHQRSSKLQFRLRPKRCLGAPVFAGGLRLRYENSSVRLGQVGAKRLNVMTGKRYK
jgi:hypothetical protein